MIKRVITRIGDVFEVNISPERKKYFQLIAFDLAQLNSDVIRVFKKEYSTLASPECNEIVMGEVEFYAHTFARTGIKLGFWKKAGNVNRVGETEKILFRGTEDYATLIGNEPVAVSNNWYVWRLGDKQYTEVGILQGENRNAEVGLVFDPASIVHRVRTGEYPYTYPNFE